jgi:hypothetical protein
MTNGIIKDFKGWNLITEAEDSSTGIYTGTQSASTSVYTGATPGQSAPASTGSADSGSADSGSADSSAVDSGSADSGSADAEVADSSDILDKESMLSGAADGKLTTDDIKKIQAVVFGVFLTDTKTCDGNVGPVTVTKIKEFRTKYEITGDDEVEPNQTTVGPLTLAKISELIKTG